MSEDSERPTAGNSERDDALSQQDAELQEGVDYYLENGLFVFTAAFLKRRGYCCERGCRHLYSIIRSVH
jgi:hypothetical protein